MNKYRDESRYGLKSGNYQAQNKHSNKLLRANKGWNQQDGMHSFSENQITQDGPYR